jgi:hypothetical protein
MDSWRLAIIWAALSCAAPAYALAVYLVPRPIPPRTVWPLALALAASLTAGATFAMRHALGGLVPTYVLLGGYVFLYFVPMIVTTAAASWLRRRGTPRWIGSVVVLLLFVASILLLRFSSLFSFDIVTVSA